MLNKRTGISLIVLVITIIVMIILATVIILSLDSSNIIERANEAKEETNLANLKEAASVYLAEYQLKVARKEIDGSEITANDYVRTELENSGTDSSSVVVTEEGKILVGVAAEFVNNNVPIGTEVVGYEWTAQESELEEDKNATWKYFGLDENGNALIVGTTTESYMYFTGFDGYLNGVQKLNSACKAVYSGKMGEARSIDLDDIIRVLEYTGEKGAYRDQDENYVPVQGIKTVNEIAKEIGYDISNITNESPEDGKEIGEYVASYIRLDKRYDASKFNPTAQDLIFINKGYWIATNYVFPLFSYNTVDFGLMFMDYSNFVMTYGTVANVDSVRPIVELAPSINLTYSNGVVTLSK